MPTNQRSIVLIKKKEPEQQNAPVRYTKTKSFAN